MARTKQTARKTTGGKAPRAALISRVLLEAAPPATTAAKKKSAAPAAAPAVVEAKAIEYDVSHESSFFAHNFSLGPRTDADFEPRLFAHASPSPFGGKSAEAELFLGMGFRSRFDGALGAAARPPVDLVVALDVSGSMSIPFTNGPDGAPIASPGGGAPKTKLQVAREALLALGAQLKEGSDRFGLVAFNSRAARVMPIETWKHDSGERLRTAAASLRASGGTSVRAAFEEAMATLNTIGEAPGRQSRVLMLTDLEVGDEDGAMFVAALRSSQRFATIVGVGLDLSSDVIAAVSKMPGCNYANVRDPSGFNELAASEFAFWINPVAFNIRLELESETVAIAEGFGSPEIAGPLAKEIRFSTEFPSSENAAGETRGGLVVFRLTASEHTPARALAKVRWEDANGFPHEHQQELVFGGGEDHQQQSSVSMRKAVLLVRYTSLIRSYIDIRGTEDPSKLPLFLELRRKYPILAKHFEAEMQEIGDSSLSAELHLLQEIAAEDDIPIELSSERPPKKQKPAVAAAAAKEDGSSLCCVCLAAKKTILLAPCRHLCVCKACSAAISSCPMCRAAITDKTEVFA